MRLFRPASIGWFLAHELRISWRFMASMGGGKGRSIIILLGIFGLTAIGLAAMVGLMLTFGGAFATFTYLRPFLETQVHATLPQLSLMLLGLGAAGFVGTAAATALLKHHLYRLLGALPLALGAMTNNPETPGSVADG